MPTKKDGSCKFLGDDDLCTIYDNRPIACRVDLMIDLAEDSEARYNQNVKLCNALMDDAGIDTSYRI